MASIIHRKYFVNNKMMGNDTITSFFFWGGGDHIVTIHNPGNNMVTLASETKEDHVINYSSH